MGRFINADDYPSTGQGLTGNNMFSYCGNNPVSRTDHSGDIWETIWDITTVLSSVLEVTANPTDPWAWAGLLGDVIDVVLPGVGGLGEAVDTAKSMYHVVEKGDDIIDALRKCTAPRMQRTILKKQPVHILFSIKMVNIILEKVALREL